MRAHGKAPPTPRERGITIGGGGARNEALSKGSAVRIQCSGGS